MKVLIVGFVVLALGLASAIPQRSIRNIPGHFNNGKELTDETATSEVFPVVLIPVLVAAAPKVVALALDLLRSAVCDTDPQLQGFEEQNAQIMALVNVMNDLLIAEENLDEVIKQQNMKNDLVAEAELFDGPKFEVFKSKLKSAAKKIGHTAKKLLCEQ